MKTCTFRLLLLQLVKHFNVEKMMHDALKEHRVLLQSRLMVWTSQRGKMSHEAVRHGLK